MQKFQIWWSFSFAMLGLIAASYAFAQQAPPNPPTNLRIRFGPPSTTLRFNSAMQIVSAKCVSCHRDGGSAADFTRYLLSESAWVDANYIVAGQSQASLLFKYLQGSGFNPAPLGTMPPGGTLSASELAVFRLWIDQLGTTLATPPPQPTTPPPPLGGTVRLPSQNYPRLGDRAFVKSILDDIFGPSAPLITNTLVLPSVSIFGGACDPMGRAPATGQGADTCAGVDVSSFAAPFVPVSSTPRAGLTMKACNSLTFNDITLQYAIRSATQRSDLTYLRTISIPTAADIVSGYNLFYPGESAPPQTVVDSLAAVAQAVQSPNFPTCPAQHSNCYLDPWRYVILTLCYQGAWQVI